MPSSAACAAAERPEGPEPMIAILNMSPRISARARPRSAAIVPRRLGKPGAPTPKPSWRRASALRRRRAISAKAYIGAHAISVSCAAKNRCRGNLMPAESRSKPVNRLLAALPSADLARIMPALERVDLVLGEILHEAGIPQKYFYFPRTCIVSLLGELCTGDSAALWVIGRAAG